MNASIHVTWDYVDVYVVLSARADQDTVYGSSPMMFPFGTEVQSQGPCGVQRCCKEMCTALADVM